MSFVTSQRRGKYWEDAKRLDKLIHSHPFHTTGKNEADFEKGFSTAMLTLKDQFNCDVITQIDRNTTVKSVFAFGKKHRPDATLDTDAIAVEIKFVTYDGLKQAIGQGYFYRLQYRFVFLVLVMSEKRKDVYEALCNNEEVALEHALRHLADNMNIFTYVVPAFSPAKGSKKCCSFFDVSEA